MALPGTVDSWSGRSWPPMRRRSPLLVLAALLLLPATSAQAASPAASQAESGRADPAGRYIVVLKKNATLKTVRDRHAREDGTHADRSFSKVIKGFAGKLSPEQMLETVGKQGFTATIVAGDAQAPR